MSMFCQIWMAPDFAASRVEVLELTNVTPLELSTLWDLVETGTISEDLFEGFERFEPVPEDPELTFQIPVSFCEALAGMAEDRFTAVAAQWAASDEVHCDPEDIVPVVEDLIRLAKLSVQQQMPLWLHVSA